MTDAPPTNLRAAMRKRLGRVRRVFVRDRYDVFLRPVRAGDERFEAPAGYRFAFGTADDVRRCDVRHTELGPSDRTAGAARLDLGHRVVVGFADDEPVFTMWVHPRCLNVPGAIKRRLADDQVFIYKAFTSPDHRGRKLYQAGMRFVLADLAAAGGRELVGYAHVKKAVSRAGLARLGFDDGGRFTVVGVGPWRRTLLSRRFRERFPEAVARSGAGLEA